MKKRLTAFALALCMLVALLPLNLITANAATTLTEEQFVQKINALKSEYPHGKYWNNHNGTDADGNSKAGSNKGTCGQSTCTANCSCSCGYFKNVGYQCFGFANLMAKKIFGSYATKTQQTSGGVNTSKGWKRIEYSDKGKYTYCAGDFVEVYNYGHSIFIIKVDSNYVYYVDCNWTGPCQINWNGKKTISAMQNWTSYIVRMSGNTLKGTGTTTHTLTVKYNSNGASIDCKQYVTAYTMKLRSSYSTSSSQLTLIPEGKTITVSETKSAGGYVWGKTTYDSKTGWCALSDSSDTYAYKRFYLSSNNVYLTDGKKAFTQALTQGVAKDLYNYTTFGLKKSGYSFVGWCAKADGSSTIFNQDDATLKPETICSDLKTKDCAITLYAIWEQNVKTISNISVQTNPNKMTYYLGDTFDPTGISIKIKYSDNSEAVVSQGLSYDYNFSNSGTSSVTIEYQGAETSFDVAVLEPTVDIIEDAVSLAVSEEKSITVSGTLNTEKTYSSLDESIAKIDENGKVFGIANGTTEVVVEMLYGDVCYSDTCAIVVGTGIKDQIENLDSASVVVDSKTARSGETVLLSITLEKANTLKSIAISNIQFDTDALELVEGQWKLDGAILSNVNIGNKTAVIAFSDNTDCNGELFTLIFRIKDDVSDGLYSVSCDVTAKHKDETGEKLVDILSVPGDIEIINIQRGDVNGDDEVSSDDAIQLLYYTLLPDLYPINQDGDFDGNGEVNSDDAIYLLYYTLLPDLYPLH